MTTCGGAYFRFELTVFRLGPLYSAIPFLPLFQLCKVCVTALVIFQETLLILLLTKINEFCLQWSLILNILLRFLSQVGGSQKKVGEQSTRGCHPMQKMHPEHQYAPRGATSPVQKMHCCCCCCDQAKTIQDQLLMPWLKGLFDIIFTLESIQGSVQVSVAMQQCCIHLMLLASLLPSPYRLQG